MVGRVKYVLIYESAENVAEKAPAHAAAHSSHAHAHHQRGSLLLIGPFENAQQHGAMGVFTTHEAAEEFALTDPFVLNGVVSAWHVRAWHELLHG